MFITSFFACLYFLLITQTCPAHLAFEIISSQTNKLLERTCDADKKSSTKTLFRLPAQALHFGMEEGTAKRRMESCFPPADFYSPSYCLTHASH